MNDPFWRGHDGSPDTGSSPSPGIPILSRQVSLGAYNCNTWPIASYSEIKHLKEMKEEIPALCQRYKKIFTPEHCKEWDDLLSTLPAAGQVSPQHQSDWHAKVNGTATTK
jgi:hypothetical protein